MNTSFENGKQFAWDSTSLTGASACPRYYQYKHIEGWSSPEKSPHLIFGGHYATALEHYWKHRTSGDDHDTAQEKIVLECLINSWEHELDENGTSRVPGTGHPWQSTDPVKTRENLIRSIIWYTEEFQDDVAKVKVLADGKPAVELSFTVEAGPGILFCGHMDKIVDYADNPYVMDQKTTKSTVSQYYFDGFDPDIQMSMYTFAGKTIFNIPVKGVIIDAASIMVGFTKFSRGMTFRHDPGLEEWHSDMLRLVAEIHQYTDNGYFPMRRTACDRYGGCEFRNVCRKPASLRPQFLKASFVQKLTWDPLIRR